MGYLTMLLIYGLLVLIIGLLLLLLLKKVNHDLPQLVAQLELLPQLLDERVANRALQSEVRLQQEFAVLKASLMGSGNELQLALNNNAHADREKILRQFNELTQSMQTGLHQFQQLNLQQGQQANHELLQQFHVFGQQISASINNDVGKLIEVLRQELERLNAKVEDKLRLGFENTTQTFGNVLERLTKIDAAQQKLDELSSEIVSLQEVLTDKKSRGIFGEVQLQQILVAAFGEMNRKVYAMQYKLNNGTIADAVLFAPQPLGVVAIDAKFPLENYRRMLDANLSQEERKIAEKLFESNVKKHIDDIAAKYIIADETGDQAVMFVPAEAVFAHINAHHDNLVDYSHRKRVWLASPTTLMAQLTTLLVVLRNLEREKHAVVIHDHLKALGLEFARYKERWDGLAKHIDTVSKDVRDIHTTTQKIGTRFDKIAQVDETLLSDKAQVPGS